MASRPISPQWIRWQNEILLKRDEAGFSARPRDFDPNHVQGGGILQTIGALHGAKLIGI